MHETCACTPRSPLTAAVLWPAGGGGDDEVRAATPGSASASYPVTVGECDACPAGRSGSSRCRRPRPRCSSRSAPGRRSPRSTTSPTSRPTRRRPTCPASSRTPRRSRRRTPTWWCSPTTSTRSSTQLDQLKIPVLPGAGREHAGRHLRADRRAGHADRAPGRGGGAAPSGCAADIDKIVKGVPAAGHAAELLLRARPDALLGDLEDVRRLDLLDVRHDERRRRRRRRRRQAAAIRSSPPEALVKANPDTIFLADTKCCQQSAADRHGADRAGRRSPRCRHGQIVALDDDIASRWGPRTVDLVQAVADAVAKVPA